MPVSCGDGGDIRLRWRCFPQLAHIGLTECRREPFPIRFERFSSSQFSTREKRIAHGLPIITEGHYFRKNMALRWRRQWQIYHDLPLLRGRLISSVSV
ncbi:MAG: hypothetical protein JWQ50_307 [Caballeronia mineralivorans]|jgi:hypothetical protein|nr:hypothetical protein [Caballeronia mineralivorans]